MGHALEPVLALHAFGCGIEAHHGWQEHRVQRAVVQTRVHTSQAVTEAVHAAQAFLKCHGALHACAHQLAPRICVIAIARGAFNMCPTASQAIKGYAVGWWVEGCSHKSFHAMGDGVHAGRGRQHGRQAIGQFRVADRSLGHQVPAVKAQLAMVVDNDDGAARHLATRAAGRGYGDQWCHSLADTGRATFNGGIVR